MDVSFSVGRKLTLTFCNCKYRSLKAESCPLKSNSYTRDNFQVYIYIYMYEDNFDVSTDCCHDSGVSIWTFYLPSNLRGKNMNTHLRSQQKLDNLPVLLRNRQCECCVINEWIIKSSFCKVN